MSAKSLFRLFSFGQEALSRNLNRNLVNQVQQTCNYWKPVIKPKPGINGRSFRRIVQFEDKYTIKPLNVKNLGGRDPVTGRVVCIGIGGGIKHKYHWINWSRKGPTDLKEPPKEEKVLDVFPDGCRTSHVALIGSGKELYYILATMNMKKGDILKTHMGIPRIAVRANEGDCYPLGALAVGTQVNCIEKYVGLSGMLCHAAGCCAIILRKGDGRVVIKMPSKREYSLDEKCMATVGRLSNEKHGDTPIGSPQRNRELGNRPRSGLWHRKTGRHGRKIHPPKPVKFYDLHDVRKSTAFNLTLSGF